jgi:hypothetical protein
VSHDGGVDASRTEISDAEASHTQISDAGDRRLPLPRERVLVIRPVTPDDLDGLVALYEGLSLDDVYRRFFSGFHPDRTFLQRLVSAPERGGFGLIAVVSDASSADAAAGAGEGDARVVAEATYELLDNGNGELGITVASDWRGWLGPVLFDALLAVAAARGVPNLEADVLTSNRAMLALARWRGCAFIPRDDWSTVRVLVGTRGCMPTWSGPHDRPRVLVEVPGGRWSAAGVAQAAGLHVLTCSGPGARPACPVLSGEACPLAAGADAIVVANPRDDERWGGLIEAHRQQHPGVPVCVQPRRRETYSQVLELPDDAELANVVTLVGRVARKHARRAASWVGDQEERSRHPR